MSDAPFDASTAQVGHRVSLQVCQLSMSSVLLIFLTSEVAEKRDIIPIALMTCGRSGLSPVLSHDYPEYKPPS